MEPWTQTWDPLVVFAFDPCPNTFGITSSWLCKQWRAKRNSPTQQKNNAPPPVSPVPVAGGKRHLLLFVGGSLRPASLLQLRELYEPSNLWFPLWAPGSFTPPESQQVKDWPWQVPPDMVDLLANTGINRERCQKQKSYSTFSKQSAASAQVTGHGTKGHSFLSR